MSILQIPTARVFKPLLAPARYKGAWGGRGSAKSHFFAGLTLEDAITDGCDIVCIREIQRTLDQSVKKLLELKIQQHNLGDYFEVQDRKVITRPAAGGRGVIAFEGMQNHTADSIKSLEGFGRAWVEEAHSLSQRSLDLLRPTIRAPGSQLWFSWNPSKATDPVDVLLRGKDPPPDSVVVEASYRDNPWFPAELREEMEYDKRRDADKYGHVWLGGYEARSESRVFRNWTVEEFDRPPGTVHRLGADWGYSIDPSVLVRCDIERNRLYVDHEAWMIGCEIVQLPTLFDNVPDSRKWFITADGSRPETISYMRNHGYPRMVSARKGAKSVEEGVAFLQSFDIVVHPRCEHVIEELTCYSYKTDPLTGTVLPILDDKNNHCIAEGVLVSCLRGDVPIECVTTDDLVLTRGGYRRVLFAGQTDADRETMVVKTSRGEVRCTPDHEIWTARGFVRADALRYDDEIINVEQAWSSALCGMAGSIVATPIAAMRRIGATFSEALRAARHGFTAMCGSFTAGLSPMGLKFTTSTATPATTISPTWRSSPEPSTSRSIRSAASALLVSAFISIASGRSQRRGTEALRGGRSTRQSERSLTRHSIPRRSAVATATHGSSRGRSGMLISIAAQLAGRLRGARRALTMWSASAWCVARRSVRTATASKRLVRGRVETLSAGPRCAKVYDLTVEEHHEFFAGGVLVSNCIDALRYACEGARLEQAIKAQYTPKPARPYRPAVRGVM